MSAAMPSAAGGTASFTLADGLDDGDHSFTVAAFDADSVPYWHGEDRCPSA